jgi:uncharacterized membrane protein YoaK (UPF0700 family)
MTKSLREHRPEYLSELSLHGSRTTAVMTTNLTRFVMDADEALLGHDPAEVAKARHRAKHTWPLIIGFVVGAGLGAACFAVTGPKSLGLPAGLALLALVMTLPVRPVRRRKAMISVGRATTGE